MNARVKRLAQARLYLVCERTSGEFLEAVLRGGVDMVQLRMKEASDDEVVAAARVVREACDRHAALFILNDRPDLVVASGADGVHVGQDDVPVAEARALVGPDRLVGLSTHTPEQVDDAEGVDYIGVGPVFETPTKPGRPAVGLELVRYAADHAHVPWFAIGGMTADRLRWDVGPAGAGRVAVVRALTEARDPESAATALRGALPRQEARVGA